METLKVLAFGHRPGGLGDLWHPRDWMPAVIAVRDYLDKLQRADGRALVVMAIPDEGFGMMVGCAALLLRGEGRPVHLSLIVPHRRHVDEVAGVQAKKWHEKMLRQADTVVWAADRWAWSEDDAADLRLAALFTAAEVAEQIVVCHNGTKDGITHTTMLAAATIGHRPTNLYGAVAEALGLLRRARPRKKRPPGAPRWGGMYGVRVD